MISIFDETLNENDEATMSFRYDIIEKEPSSDRTFDTPEFHEYAGNILVTLIIQALNVLRREKILNIKESDENRNHCSFKSNNK
jgi:hypothetical protein